MSRSMRSEASSLHASEPVVSTDHLATTGLGEAEVPSGRRPQSTEPLFPTRGRLLHATTDWRFLCRPISFDTGSAAAVGRQGRWTQRSFIWLATGSGRWKVENFDSNGCVHRAREAGRRRRCIAGCAERRAGEATYTRGEKVRERAGVAGEARARRISRPGDRTGEHTGTRRLRFGRAGVHTENAWKQTRRQRFGVAGRCDVHRGGDVRAGQRAGSGSVQSARLVWRRR